MHCVFNVASVYNMGYMCNIACDTHVCNVVHVYAQYGLLCSSDVLYMYVAAPCKPMTVRTSQEERVSLCTCMHARSLKLHQGQGE